jgi:predicted aspartyl protease
MATQTEVLRQILQMQQQITQQMNRGPPHGANHEGPNQVTTYAQFIGMKPPTFSKAEDPLEAEAWIKAIKAKFSAFVLPCSEENKANFAALQLRGEALMWWDHFKSMQRGRAVTWEDFKQAFKSHHIPKGLMDRKMRELLALRQASDTVYRYAQKFNNLCQYGGHHVDSNAKKMERFRDGLDGKLYEWMNLLEPENFYELVNKAISQEDAMKKAHRDKKRPSGFAPRSGTNKKFRFVKKNVPNPSQQSSTGRWTMKPSQSKPLGNFQFRNAQQQAPKPNAPPRNVGDRCCFNCGQLGHYISDCPKPRQIKPNPQNQGSGNKAATPAKKPMVQVHQGKLNFTTMNDISEGASVLTGTFSINDTPVKILFDSGATHSFISVNLLGKFGLKGMQTKSTYKITTPGGNISSHLVTFGVPLKLGSKVIQSNLITIKLKGMDVILGMDWMTQHKVVLDISDRVLEINSPTVGHTTLYLPFQDVSVRNVVPTLTSNKRQGLSLNGRC